MSGGAGEVKRLLGDRYELEVLIGKGGVGEVWRARHVALNSRVAIKFLQMASAQKESAKRRFSTEAQITAQLKTSTAVQVFDYGVTEAGQPYLVMELLEGETLGRRLERVHRLTAPETSRLLGQAARALHRAHQLGIVHRDFKPDNIVICVDDEGRDQVKVLDFGIAKLVGVLDEVAEADASKAFGEPPSFTRTGAVLGTPLYMAPEQIRNAADVDLRADIWALGVVAFECLTGRPPFRGGTFPELFERIQSGLHPSPTLLEPSVPPAFEMWFDIACAPDPAKRFLNASVAYRHLAVALDTLNNAETSASFPGTQDSHSASGERRILGRRAAAAEDDSAPTAEVAPDGKAGEVRGRTHDSDFASLQRIALHPLGETPHPVGVNKTTSVVRERLATRAWIVALVGAVVAAGVTVWQLAPHAGSVAAPTPASGQSLVVAPTPAEPSPPPQSSVPSQVPRASPASEPSEAPGTVESQTVAASASARAGGTRSPAPTSRAMPASSASAKPAPSSAPPAAAPSVPVPAPIAPIPAPPPASLDPGSYR